MFPRCACGETIHAWSSSKQFQNLLVFYWEKANVLYLIMSRVNYWARQINSTICNMESQALNIVWLLFLKLSIFEEKGI